MTVFYRKNKIGFGMFSLTGSNFKNTNTVLHDHSAYPSPSRHFVRRAYTSFILDVPVGDVTFSGQMPVNYFRAVRTLFGARVARSV
jgi:hypothetical protein